MTKRDNLVRALLLAVVLAVVGGLLVLDRTRGDDRPDPTEPTAATPQETSRPGTRTAPGAPEERGGAGEPGERDPSGEVTATPIRPGAAPEAVSTLPPGVEDIACQLVQRSVDITVMSFNTHRSFGASGLERVAAEIAAYDPDIVLLQEVDNGYGRTGHVDQAAWFGERLGMDHAFGANVVSGGGQYGTAILSRFDILDTGHQALPNGPGGEQRGLQWASVVIGGQEVRLYNTHLQNRIVGLRESQARTVAGLLAQDDALKILGGDMNATAGTATLAPLEAVLVDSFARVGAGSGGTGPNGSRIDFLLASPELVPTASRVARSAVSDHARVVTDFTVPASTACPTARHGRQDQDRD